MVARSSRWSKNWKPAPPANETDRLGSARRPLLAADLWQARLHPVPSIVPIGHLLQRWRLFRLRQTACTALPKFRRASEGVVDGNSVKGGAFEPRCRSAREDFLGVVRARADELQ